MFERVVVDFVAVFLLHQGGIVEDPVVAQRIIDKMKIDRRLKEDPVLRVGAGLEGEVQAGNDAG